jgi:hypothetical protein
MVNWAVTVRTLHLPRHLLDRIADEASDFIEDLDVERSAVRGLIERLVELQDVVRLAVRVEGGLVGVDLVDVDFPGVGPGLA